MTQPSIISPFLVSCLVQLVSGDYNSLLPTGRPGSCFVDGKWYDDGVEIDRDENNCSGRMCMGGDLAYWDDECMFGWPDCDGIQEHVPGKCCPNCIIITTSSLLIETTRVTTETTASLLRDGQCEDRGRIYRDGETIESSPCYGAYCENGDIIHWDHACVFSTPFCDGMQVNVPGECCPRCVVTSGTPTMKTTTTSPGCYVDGILYEIGAGIPDSDPCNYCTCSQQSTIECGYMDCTQPQCDNPISIPGQCCRECPEHCEVNGTIYEFGDLVPNEDTCLQCVCTPNGQECEPLLCPPLQCINPVRRKGQCCASCLDGPNCAFGRRLIPVGETFKPFPQISCSCETDPWEPLAFCHKDIGEKKAARILKRKRDFIDSKLLALLLGK